MEFLLPILSAAAIILYLAWQVYSRQNKLKLVDDEIREFYQEEGREVQGISGVFFPVIPPRRFGVVSGSVRDTATVS